MEKPNLNPSNHEATLDDKQKIGQVALSKIDDYRRERVSRLAQEYLLSEKDFIEHGLERFDTMSYEEFSKWEDDASVYFTEMTKETSGLHLDRYQRDRLQNIKSTIDPQQSIEACSGKWYRRRQAALVNAINQSDDPNKNEDLLAIDDTYRHVGEHIYYMYDSEEKMYLGPNGEEATTYSIREILMDEEMIFNEDTIETTLLDLIMEF